MRDGSDRGSVGFQLMKPPYWPDWLAAHPERRCRARSKQAKRRCLRISVPGRAVCVIHGGRSAGPWKVRFDCRPDAFQSKIERSRARWMRHGSGYVRTAASADCAHVLTPADIAALMASRGRS
jgi:hypothetical protein